MIIVVSLALLYAAVSRADTPVSGSVSGTWTASGSPYVVVGSVTVDSGLTLTIDESVTVLFGSNESMTVNGTLITHGMPSQGVVFTSPDSIPGSWLGIYAQQGSVVDMNNTALLWAGQGTGACLVTTSGTADSITVRNSFVRHSANDGMRISALHIFLENVTATDNAADGIELNTFSEPPQLDNLRLDRNGERALALDNNPGNLPGNLSGSGNGINGVYVAGNLGGGSASGRWTWRANPGFPVVCQTINVSSDTLDVEAGAVIKMYDANSTISIQTDGVLLSGLSPAAVKSGTSGGDVWITSLLDDQHGGDTNGDGSASAPSPGDWSAVFAQSSSTLHLVDTWFSYGGHSIYGNLTTTSGQATELTWSGGGAVFSLNDGIRINVNSATVTGVRFAGNLDDGVQVASGTGATFAGCDILDNESDGMRWGGGPVVLAQGNWWGDPSGPQHPTLNPGGLGNPVSDNVDFGNWATSAFTNAGPDDFLLTAPADGATLDLAATGNDSVRFTWNAAIDPDGDDLTYELAVNATPTFDPGSEVFHASGLTSTSQWATGFAPNSTYYWCVSATDGLVSRSSTPAFAAFSTAPDSSLVPVVAFPSAFTVGHPAPNPFTSHSQIAFALPTSERVSVRIYDLRGRLVKTLLDGVQSSGRQFVIWDGRDHAGQKVASGVYFAHVVSRQGARVRRLLVVR